MKGGRGEEVARRRDLFAPPTVGATSEPGRLDLVGEKHDEDELLERS